MDLDELYTTAGDDAVVLNVHLQPGAGRTSVVGRHGSALKVRVAVPPEAGRANEACATLLTGTFAAASVELVGGEKSREKRFKIGGIDLDDFRRQLERAVEDAAGGPGPENRQSGRR
ncbi:MAG: DUF167 domain-containing protein [Acidimicrobiales bacterium]